MRTLNLFYKEPDPDRWFKYDRFPRKLIRSLVRGAHQPGGVMMVALNLMKGLDKLGVKYRFNDYRFIKNNPKELACIIGKANVLYEQPWKNPILFGAGIFSHPVDRLNLLTEYPTIKKILVPGEWMRLMFEPYYGNKVLTWPVGIDTDEWCLHSEAKKFDFLIYDKVRWEHDLFQETLITPITKILNSHNLSFQFIKYGSYKPAELRLKLSESKSLIFLCEHETQGLAYQQVLSTDTPILGWDRGGYWQDPSYHPDRVRFQNVSSLPYWDSRCGEKFSSVIDFESKLLTFIKNKNDYAPRSYILDNLTLEKSAKAYLAIVKNILDE